MSCVVAPAFIRGLCAILALQAIGTGASAPTAEGPAVPPQPELLTNLLQLRRWADFESSGVHPFRIEAEVLDADSACGVLALQDTSGVEFIRLDCRDGECEPGTTVQLEGRGCAVRPRGFGLAVVPGLVVDNDGLHGNALVSGSVVLPAGVNPITVQWFNGIGEFNLSVEYQGPDLPCQRIPDSVLLRRTVNRATGRSNYSPGLDYRVVEGTWGSLPDFTKCRAVKTGVARNIDLDVRTRNDAVGVEYTGFLRTARDGVYTFYVASDDGSRLFVGEPHLDVRVLTTQTALEAAVRTPATAVERINRSWLTLEGTTSFVGVRASGGELLMRVGSDEIRVEIFESGDVVPNFPPGTKVHAFGLYQQIVTEEGARAPGVLRVSSWKAVRPAAPSVTRSARGISNEEATGQPAADLDSAATRTSAITTVADVKALAPESARQQLPVSIRGVVTATLPAVPGAVVQDSTGGVFVFLQDLKKTVPFQIGDFCQIDGVTTPGLFAPSIVARELTRIGAGEMPQPLRATWDQLVNGSLDTQYAEIDGVVTGVQNGQLMLLTEGGRITVQLFGFRTETLVGYENALIRIRGCVFAPFNNQTRRLETGPLGVRGAAVQVLAAAPSDVFDVPQKSIGELLLYDPKATALRWLKVSGQIVDSRPGEHFLTDGTNGMHVTTRSVDSYGVGDLVDVVGFLDLGGPVAELKEAMVRKTGHAALPAPTKLSPERLLLARYGGTLVRVEATLMNQWRGGSEHVLELQSGFVAFRARLSSRDPSVRLPPTGSRLELTGVHAPQGSRRRSRNVTGFDLLLHSPTDIRVLATPPWWTLKRVLVLAGTLGGLLCVVLVWNKELRWQVQERSRTLEMEIRHRQRAELQHAAEAERSRIARDLHDELGAGLTEVSLLASAGLGASRGVEKNTDRFRVIADKARGLVSGLDVIVWAVDPQRDSLQSFADYLGSYAKELLSASGLVCRLRIPIECDAIALPGPVRHGLFLAVKEALNNVIRHASAAEVELQVEHPDHRLEIVITDDGCGFDGQAVRHGHGLQNLHERLEVLRGQCQIESQPGKGTTVKLMVPLPDDPI